MREPLLVLDSALQEVCVNHSFYQIFKVQANEVMHRPVYELSNQKCDIPALRMLLEGALNNGEVFDNYLAEHDFPANGHRKVLLNARRIVSKIEHV